MFLIESPDRVFSHIEPIDFENDEYLFWNAEGHGVRLTLEKGELTKIEEADNEITVREAFQQYSLALGSTVDTTGALPEVWARLQAQVKPQSWLSRLVRNILGSGCLLFVAVVAVFILVLLVRVLQAIFTR